MNLRLCLPAVAAALAGCASAPPLPPQAPPRPPVAQPAPPSAVAPMARPAAPPAAPPASAPTDKPAMPKQASAPPSTRSSPVAAPPASAAPLATSDAAARYERVPFASLPATSDGDWIVAWRAFLHSCEALGAREPWRDTCARSATVDRRSAATIRGFFATGFDVHRVRAVSMLDGKEANSRDTGLVTGYYEPLLKGSRRPSPKYPVPIYRVPDDLIVVDLASVYPELSGLRLRGKLEGRKVVPYPSRREINATNALRGRELLWVDDPIDAFFLQVQGSGRVQFEDGRVTRLGYGENNGHPYRSIGRWLVEQGELTIDQASMQGIKGWVARNPQRLNQLLEQNPSFVFFRELPLGDPGAGPKGALGVPLTPGASLAVDSRHIPLGVPVVLSSTDPSSGAAFTRPMMAQDTGTAIRGPLRFDYFWGYGAEAGEKAGRQKHEGSAWVLTPKGVAPDALLKR